MKSHFLLWHIDELITIARDCRAVEQCLARSLALLNMLSYAAPDENFTFLSHSKQLLFRFLVK